MSTETTFKNGDVITDGLVNGEIIGEGQLGRMRIDGYRIRITSGNEKGHESFISKADAELVVDKSANSSIMTNNKEGDDNDTNTNLLRKTGDLHPGTVGNHGDDVSQREQTVQENERQGQEGTGTTQGGGSATLGKELNLAGLSGLRGMAESNPGGNSGSEQRLTEPPRPAPVPPAKDIKLDEHSDIGYNSGAAARYDANLAAIKTLKTIEDEHRQATPEEQTVLSKYSGFGDSGMGGAFPAYEDDSSSFTNSPWGRRRAELKALTTKEEFENIEHSRLNAFYTTPQVISSMWKALVKMGVDKLSNPHVLEPSAGSGRFLGYEPKELADKSQRVAVELDSLTGRILRQMYPQADTYVMGFEHAPIPKDSIDVAISNVPFGNYPIFDPTFRKGRKKLTESIHNYFFAKTLEELRPGGVLAFITSHQTLDAPSAKPVRQALADQADLVGAIRLPNNAFPDTQVVTDIIFMRKRMEGEKPGDQSWVDTVPQQYKLHSRYGDDFDTKLDVNKYFVEHPDMVLGKPSANGTMNPRRRYDEGEYTVEPPATPLSELLSKAVTKLPKDIITEAPPNTRRDLKMKFQSGHGVDEGRHVIGEDGLVYVKQGGSLQSANLTHAEEERVKAMMAIRDASKAVVDLQVGNGSDEELEKLQADLDDKYRKFVKSNGPLSTPLNHDLMDKDPDAPFLRALEDNSVYKKDKKDLTAADQYLIKVLEGKLPVKDADFEKIQMPVFNQRIIHGLGERAVSTYSDAESVVKNEVGSLDFRMMGEMLGQSENDVIQGLSDRRLIFKNPMTSEWEPADQYLSGDVRLKLREAEAAASARPKEYKANVEALKIVQPKDIPAGQISVHMGVPWVPATDYNQFVKDLLIEKDEGWRYHRYSYRHDANKEQYFKYNDITGEWQLIHHPDADMAAETETYGTPRMKADEIIRRVLNGKLVEVNDQVEGEDGKKHPVRNPEETIAAQEKAKLIQEKFQEWLWQDPDRTKRLAAEYNDKFNNYRPRVFDGAHQVLPGITEKWSRQMHAHQKDAIWRVVQDRTALLAHEVGFGKTAVMVASGMELRRMGLSRKNLYVVPKSTHAQFRDQFLDLYPYAKVLFPTEEDFTPEKRPEFMARAVTGDWDAIIVADSQFSKIPLKPETEARFIADEIETIKQALQQEEEANGTGHYATAKQVPSKNKTQKEIQKQLERYEVKFQYLQQKIAEKTDKAIHFEDIGIDQMYVDEADAYKNLKFVTRMGRIKGLPNSESDRAWDMYSKVRTLQEQKHNGVVFATGTPIANTIAEMYTMMRYLQEPLLEEKGIKHFDAWAKTFGETTESLEQTPTGAYRLTQRFAKFSNAPELSNMWQGTADIRVADEVPAMVAQRPRIVDRNGKSKRIVVATPPDQVLLDYMKELAERADNLKNVSRTEDNMLKIASDARKASLDMRLVKADAPVNQNGKVAAACKEIAKIHSETTADKGTQLVFLDLGTPKAKDKEKEIEIKLDQDGNEIVDFEEDDETQEEKNLLKDVYKGIKAQLIADGIPENEIAFIHDAKNQKQRVALYGKVNKGQIRVMVGSTGKMGAGVNVQERVAALHHIDAPWRPRDIEQREGRAIRQGNIVYGPQKDEFGNILNPGPGVKIFTYVTERSFDAYMWQAIEAKAKAIKSIMRRAVPPRTIEDVDSFTMSASEAKAVASGNPDVFKAVTLKNAVTRFAMLKASHTDSVIRARSKLNEIDEGVKNLQSDIAKLEKDVKLYHENARFDVEIQGEDFTGTEKDKMDDTSEKASELRARAGEALVLALKKAKDNEKIGTYHGFDIIARDEGPQGGYRIELRNPETKRPHVSTAMGYQAITPSGALIRLDNEYKGVLKGLLENQHELAKLESNRKTYEAQEAKKFEYEDKLAKMQAELADVEKRLQSGEVSNTPSDNYVAEELPEVEGEEAEAAEPAYHYNERADEKTEVANDKAEIAATKAEVESVEKETEVKTAPAIEEVAAANKIEEPTKVIESERPMLRENGATTKAEQEKQASTIEKEAAVNEQPKVETPIVKPEKAKLAPFPGNDPQKTSGSFNVYNLDAYISGKHLTTPAEKVIIPGFEEYNFFIARPTTTGGKFSNKNWDIYEATTGMSIGTLKETKQKAIDEAVHKLTDFVGKEKLTKAIADGLEKQGRDRALAPQPQAAAPEQSKVEAEVVTAPVESSLVQAVRAENHKEEERLAKQGGTGKMVLMTKELAKQFPKLYSGEKVPEADRVVIAKFFHPMSHQTWYATEYDTEEQIFYGYVDTGDQDSEWGNFSLAEMQDLKVKGLGMERDIHFTPQKIGNVSGLQDRFKMSHEPEVKGTFRQDVPIGEVRKEKKASEMTAAPEPKAPAIKEEGISTNPKLDDEFYANMSEGRGFKPIKAKKVFIPGYEKFDLYLHHPVSVDNKGDVVEDKDKWGISEGHSGLYLGDDITSYQADWAVDRLKSKLARKMTPDKLEQSVENAIKSTGESPKYETETPIAKMQRQVHEINNMPKSETPAATKVEEPTHPFIGLYKGKQYESHAVSMYAAQKEIAKRVGARHDYDVSVYAATETEPLAAAIEHEKTQPEEMPYIEEGGKATRKSKPSIETQAVAQVQQQIPEEVPIIEGNKVGRATKPTIETTTKPKLAAFVEVAEKLESAPVEMKGNRELHDYAGMNPEAAKVMGWPDKDKAILVDEHQPQKTEVKDVVHEVVEVEEMKQGETYHDAHFDALKAETTIKTPEQLAEKVDMIRGEKTALTPEKKLFVKVGANEWPVKSLKDASEKYQHVIKEANVGSSQIPPEYTQPLIVDENGKAIGYIAYNGNVFEGEPGDWTSETKRLYGKAGLFKGESAITKFHDDGDLTVKKGDSNYVVTTEGKAFKEVKLAPELKDVIKTSHELGEKATQEGQAVNRGTLNAEKVGSTPPPATKEIEPMREGHPITEAENRAIHAWYGEHGGSNHGGKKRVSVLTTKQRESLPDSAFAIPEERKYPIHDKNHAKAAFARVAEFGTPEEKQRVAKAIAQRYPEEEVLNSYAKAKASGSRIMMTPLKNSPHHPVAPKGSRVSTNNAAPRLTKPHMTRKGRGLTRRSDR